MANMVISNIRHQGATVEGLGTTTFIVPTTGPYRVRVRSTMVPISGLIITINLNSTGEGTSPTISVTEQALSLEAKFQATAADTITVVLTSTGGNNDIIPNDVKSTIVIDLL